MYLGMVKWHNEAHNFGGYYTMFVIATGHPP